MKWSIKYLDSKNKKRTFLCSAPYEEKALSKLSKSRENHNETFNSLTILSVKEVTK